MKKEGSEALKKGGDEFMKSALWNGTPIFACFVSYLKGIMLTLKGQYLDHCCSVCFL